MPSKKLICIGKIKTAHGVKGEIKIDSYTDLPETIAEYPTLFNYDGSKQFVLNYRSLAGKYFIASIENVHNRTDSEALKGQRLYIYRDTLPSPEEESFYHEDLFGLNAESENGTVIGTIKTIHNFGAGDIIEITLKDSTKTEMYPFTKEVVPIVDISNKKIIIAHPDIIYIQDEEDEATKK